MPETSRNWRVTGSPGRGDAAGGPLSASAEGRTHRGAVRRENQDRFQVLPFDGGAGLLLAVADGMGGPAGGSEAAAIATRVLEAALADGGSVDEGADGVPGARFAERLERATHEAHAAIRRAAALDPGLRGMGTTLTAAGVVGRTLRLIQIGDSRAYLFREGKLEQLTRDQSMVQEMLDSGVMTPEQAERSPHRNVILQALGVDGPIEPVATARSLEPGDRILLCTDGLSGVLPQGRIGEILARGVPAAETCDALVEATLRAGAPDNVTCVVADLR